MSTKIIASLAGFRVFGFVGACGVLSINKPHTKLRPELWKEVPEAATWRSTGILAARKQTRCVSAMTVTISRSLASALARIYA